MAKILIMSVSSGFFQMSLNVLQGLASFLSCDLDASHKKSMGSFLKLTCPSLWETKGKSDMLVLFFSDNCCN